MADCPINEQWNHWDPCPVCGALGPWYESDECPRPVDTGDDLHQILGEALRSVAVPSEQRGR